MRDKGSIDRSVLTSYDPSTLKKYLQRVNKHIDWYKDQKNEELFNVVSDKANIEMVRRFEKYHGVKIIGIAECGQTLHLTLYNPSIDQVLKEGTKINHSQTSTTVQNLGATIAEIVMQRSKEEPYKRLITQEMVNTAARAKYTLERKMVA